MKSFLISSVLVIGTMAASCTKSDLQPIPVPGGNETTVGISLSAAAMEAPVRRMSVAQTKAAAVSKALNIDYGTPATKAALTTDDENKVYDLWVVQFDKGTGSLVGQPYYASSEQIGQNGTTVNLEARLTTASKTQTVYFVANTHSPSLFHAGNCGTASALEQVCSEIGKAYRPTAASGLPMLAVQEYASIASGTPLEGATLRRLVAKVVLRYKLSSSMKANGFTVSSIRLRNVPAAIRYAVEQTAAVDYPALEAGSHIDYPAEDLAEAGTDGDYSTFTWYMPENLRQAVTTVSDDKERVLGNTDGAATYIEIRGDLKSPQQSRRVTYSVMLGAAATDVNDYNVRRNTVYTVTVDIEGTSSSDNRVTIETFDMSNSAMIKPNSGDDGAVTFDIRKCLNNGFTTETALNGMLGASSTLTADVLWQDGNVINTADVNLDTENGLLTVKSSKTTQGNAVVALYPDANKTQGTILWSWHIWVTNYAPEADRHYLLGENSKWDVPGGQVHTYGSSFTTANPGKVIMDRDLGATKAYYTAPAAGDMTAQEAFGMFYQWGRKDPLPHWAGTGSTDDAYAETITIYGPNGTTELAEGAKDNTTAAGYKRVIVTSAGVISGNNSLAYAVKNPLTFIYCNAELYDWYATIGANQNDALWGTVTKKGAYDPCPKGWRVPPDGTWNDFGNDAFAAPFYYYIDGAKQTSDGTPAFARSSRNGRLYEAGNVKAWYPATGSRDAGNNNKFGALLYVGYCGHSWAYTPSETHGQYLSFGSKYLGPNYGSYRADGRQVRCIQE